MPKERTDRGRWAMLRTRRPMAGLLILIAVGSMALFFTPPNTVALHTTSAGLAAPDVRTAGALAPAPQAAPA
ncbi:MAG: hypothetical protein ACREDE_11945, partial [Thermoplasmata archaeon]